MFRHLDVHHEVEDIHFAKFRDCVRDPPQERRDVVLSRPSRIRLREVPRGPARGNAHTSIIAHASVSTTRFVATRPWLSIQRALLLLTNPLVGDFVNGLGPDRGRNSR